MAALLLLLPPPPPLQLSTCDWIHARGWFLPQRGQSEKDEPVAVRSPPPEDEDAPDEEDDAGLLLLVGGVDVR